MASHSKPPLWDKTLSLDRHRFAPPKNSSFLHSQQLRQTLLESRKAFLNLPPPDDGDPREDPAASEPKRAKKISFKVKKTPSIYRRNANKVSELAMKFNTMSEKPSILEQPKYRKMLTRASSQSDSDRVTRKPRDSVVRKPSVKTKPAFLLDDKVTLRRVPMKNKVTSDNKVCVRAKIGYLEAPERPTTLSIANLPKISPKPKLSPTAGSVKAAIEIFERRSSETSPTVTPTNQVPKSPNADFEDVQIVTISAVLPQRRCDSMYETLNMRRVSDEKIKAKSEEAITIKPNTSFLWSSNKEWSPQTPQSSNDDWRSLYEFVDAQAPLQKNDDEDEDKIYEELNIDEVLDTSIDDGYEYCASPNGAGENIYETLPPPLLPRRQQLEPLPPRPPSRSSGSTMPNGEDSSNCYESIYNPESNFAKDSNYESIYGSRSAGSNRDSLVSEQKSNSLYGRESLMVDWGDGYYGGRAPSDLSSSDKSDDWVDLTDNEETVNSSGIIIVREKQKCKNTCWSQKLREQWSKSPRKLPIDQGIDSDHHYESLCNSSTAPDDDYDSFDSDSESEKSFHKITLNDSGVDIGTAQLPDPPNSQYGLTRLAATAGKHMRKLRRNWSLTKNDITKSLSRMTKRKSRIDLEPLPPQEHRKSSPEILVQPPEEAKPYQNVEPESKTLPRKGFLNKFRRSMSLSADLASEVTTSLESKPKSTFYLTEDIDIDDKNESDSGASLSPACSKLIRPQSPPPQPPPKIRDKRSTSWYAEVGLFKNSDNILVNKRPSTTFWYAEVGLYQPKSTPSTSSGENSGNNSNFQDNSEEYYNMKNYVECYNGSIKSDTSSDTKKDESLTIGTPDIQLRLQDEPLYQFYDAAVLESVCSDGISDFDSEGYEEVVRENTPSPRPTAMELVSPSSTLFSITRTLWCEIPEVINSSVLSTLSGHQKKLQEAKFEMITSEASYLNSLNVLTDHFILNLKNEEFVTLEELDVLFGEVAAVKNCSEKLLHELEKCWQDNILLHGVCDIVKKHAEENFTVYVSYCENQILLDETLKRIKERPAFNDFLKQLEASSTCQSLTLYSFLMLPMQRVTRWPLLVDAVLKRLSPQDSEYLTCQFTLATINKIVNQCNEGARRKERENEVKKIALQLEFAKGVAPVEIVTEERYLIRSGGVTHMQQRTDELKLTFGKRFNKVALHLFLFNDLLFITKPKSENVYSVIHYCRRSLVELNSTDMLVSLPVKDTQGRHLLFLTLLENQNDKTVEFLLACSSETDQERWIEALTPPKSEDPDETLYECWDCPQVTAVHNYFASQPDELALARGDVINVLRKMVDGWFHGERIRDGQTGWFPANYTAEIANPHVRSRNLKQRYRLLAFSENYLKAK